MHSRDCLSPDDFRFRRGPHTVRTADVFRGWTSTDRLVVIAPDPLGDLVPAAGLVLSWTEMFYGRPTAQADGFFDYPSHYVVGGEPGTQPRVLGPASEAPWSEAWCCIDIWPSIRHLVADPNPGSMLAAAFMLEPTVMLWPARLPRPESITLPAGPDEDEARSMLRARLREVWLYGEELRDTPGAWQLEWQAGAAALAREAVDYLPQGSPAVCVAETTHLVHVEPERFLGFE